MLSPLDQFLIVDTITVATGVFYSFCAYLYVFTNAFFSSLHILFLVMIGFLISFLGFEIFGYNLLQIWVYIQYTCFFILVNVLNQRAGKLYYFLLVLYAFIVIGIINVTGLLPYIFVLTSQFSVTLSLAFGYFGMLNLWGTLHHGLSILNVVFPGGSPFFLLPIIILIELISYTGRIFSLAIRLFANITAGHVLLQIIAGFLYLFIALSLFWLVLLGGLLLMSLVSLEFFICLLQAYVFVILTNLYYREILSLGTGDN